MGNKLKLQISPAAQADMEQIFEYTAFELKNLSAAVGQIADFQNALENVCSFPESCPCTRNEYVKERSLRKLIVNNYIVFYQVKGDEIQVVRVLYGMRDFASTL